MAQFMVKEGFIRGVYNPCLYWHKERDIEVMVHGDDFVSTAEKKQLKWFKDKLEARFKAVKTQVVGDGTQEEKEGRILNRIGSLSQDGSMSQTKGTLSS